MSARGAASRMASALTARDVHKYVTNQKRCVLLHTRTAFTNCSLLSGWLVERKNLRVTFFAFLCHGGAALIDCRFDRTKMKRKMSSPAATARGRAPVCVESECISNARTSFFSNCETRQVKCAITEIYTLASLFTATHVTCITFV